MLLDDALRAVDIVRELGGPIVDVGSGGGSPGIPLATALPAREVTLLEAERRKCDFLERWAPPNARVVWGRAEEQEPDAYGVALAKALAQPPVATEWCLALVRPGGAAVLWLGAGADLEAVAAVSAQLGGGAPEVRDGLVVVPKLEPTPSGFPRRPGIARKRPLR
jgi:16S rRNA (guanine527-N7)-methyltransferase